MASNLTTPLASASVQSRRGPQKRQCLDLNSSPVPRDLELQADALLKDETLPSHVRMVVSWLLEDRRQLSTMLEQYRKLSNQVDVLTSECANLKSAIDSQKSLSGQSSDSQPAFAEKPSTDSHQCPAPPTLPVRGFDDAERARSLVFIGVPESTIDQPSARVAHDFQCVREIMDFLGIECAALAVYRMGRSNPSYPRLLKVVLPSSFFAKQMLRRAPRLKHFKAHGVFLRPSLTKEERERQRAERVARRSSHASASVMPVNHECISIQDTSNDKNVTNSSPSNL
ncbi:hypothetical protein Y032_0128g1464 [Ancylostoma ceylanicum]|uniref:Uncharacterized protein n=1 Tax=Ancylostoma ceylanicum TaxID=53326 RepID=A0A016T847_9BILA|nr:hypothetical protein Y032_0128g1464 [Ancylostoma ceylanicum]